MASKIIASKLANLEFSGLGRRYEYFVRSSINDFRERNTVITNPSFAVGSST